MSGYGTRPTAGSVPVGANRQALLDALMGVPARVGGAFTNMAQQGLAANERFMSGEGADQPFLPSMDSGGRVGELASFLSSNMAMGGPAGSLGAGPSMMGKAAAAPKPQGIRAYHGSPHDFDRFDMSKIGTGEGAQAYGHGLYFAENEGVAKAYRNQLANGFASADGAEISRPMQQALEFVHPKFKESGDMRAGLDDAIRRMVDQSEFYRKTYGDGWNIYDGALEKLRAVDPDSIKPAGRMYEVNINARPEQFLDWDAPLSAQPQSVQSLAKEASFGDPSPNLTGKSILDAVFTQTGPDARSRAMLEAGIPGIRYLDEGSRNTQQAFIAKHPRGGENTFNTQAELDAFVKRNPEFTAIAPKQTSNYVVFDDKLIEILRKYGLAGLLAGGTAMSGGEANANALANALAGQPQE